jgi:hypothetical protein
MRITLESSADPVGFTSKQPSLSLHGPEMELRAGEHGGSVITAVAVTVADLVIVGLAVPVAVAVRVLDVPVAVDVAVRVSVGLTPVAVLLAVRVAVGLTPVPVPAAV